MSIRAGVVVAGLRSAPVGAKPTSTGRRAPFQKVDGTPDAEACAECDHESLKYINSAVKKIHSVPPFTGSFAGVVTVLFAAAAKDSA